MRHAKTEQQGRYTTDFKRKLKKRGHEDARLIGEKLKNEGFMPTLIISSPALRAIQTAKIMASVFSIQEAEIIEAQFLYDGYKLTEFINTIAGMAHNHESLMIVGHNPDIASLAMAFTAKEFYHYPTSAVAVLSFPCENWHETISAEGELLLFAYPEELK